MTVSPNVSPSSDENRASGSEPGALIWMSTAEPSSTLTTAARAVISDNSLRRSVSTCRASARSAGQRGNQVEDRHVHRDHDTADDDAKESDHHWFHQRQQAGDCRVDF